jgi:hypothetical protein
MWNLDMKVERGLLGNRKGTSRVREEDKCRPWGINMMKVPYIHL